VVVKLALRLPVVVRRRPNIAATVVVLKGAARPLTALALVAPLIIARHTAADMRLTARVAPSGTAVSLMEGPTVGPARAGMAGTVVLPTDGDTATLREVSRPVVATADTADTAVMRITEAEFITTRAGRAGAVFRTITP
jgi:hypothetical protein